MLVSFPAAGAAARDGAPRCPRSAGRRRASGVPERAVSRGCNRYPAGLPEGAGPEPAGEGRNEERKGALPSGDVAERSSRAAGLESRAHRSGSRPRSSAGGGKVLSRAGVLFWGESGMVLGCDCEKNLERGCSLRDIKLA